MTNASVNDALAVDPIQIGRRADVVAEGTGIGVDVVVENRNGVGIGRDAQSLGADATAIGTETRAPSNWNTVIGYQAGSVQNGENVVAIGRKAEVEGNNGVAVGESARANADDVVAVGRDSAALEADATALGRNATANAAGAIAIGQGTANAAPNSVGIGDRDYAVADGRGLQYPSGTGPQTLVSKPVDGTFPAGDPVGYDLEVGGTTVATVFAESDGAGGIQNPRLDVPVSLSVAGSTTEVDDVVTGDILVEDGGGNTQFRFDATVNPNVANFFDNNVTNFGVGDSEPIKFGDVDDFNIQFSPGTGQNGALEIVDSQNSDVEMKFFVGGGVEYANQSIETKLSEGGDFFKLVNAASSDDTRVFYDAGGVFNLTVRDSSASTTRDILQIDPSQAAQLDVLGTLNFPSLTGTPTFSGHDHSEGGLTDVPNAGLVNDSVTVSSGIGLSSGGTVALGGSVTLDHANTTSEGDLTAGAGAAIDSVSLDQFGHVTGLSTESFDSRYDDYSSWTFEEGDGESTTVTSGERAIINGGGQINTELVSTNPPQININHNNTTSEGDLTAGAGAAIDSVSIDGNGHVTGLGTEDFDARFVNEGGDTMSGGLTVNNTVTANRVDVNGVSGSASTDASRGLGAPSIYTNVVEAQSEKGGQSTYIQLSSGGPKSVDKDEIAVITDGIIQTVFNGAGIQTEGELTENAAL
jgi:hypothetical protein